MLEPLTRTARRDAIAYAARRPYENAFLEWALEDGRSDRMPAAFVLHRQPDGAVTGLAYFGTQLVLAADNDAAVDAFARETRRRGAIRSIVGPSVCVEALWMRVRDWHRAPSLVRGCQPVYVLERGALTAGDDVPVRLATLDDAEIVTRHSAEMMAGELGYDPRDQRLSFAAGVRRAIGAGLWWVWIDGGRLRFQCNIGARTRATLQIAGVWSPPENRGRGDATRALRAIAARLLRSNVTLSLYVNDFNAPAIALYERLGFVRSGTMSTMLFS